MKFVFSVTVWFLITTGFILGLPSISCAQRIAPNNLPDPGIIKKKPPKNPDVVTIQASNQSAAARLIPPSPDAASLGNYAAFPVSLFNGKINIDLPLHTIQQREINIPISLSYNSSGIRVEEEASQVGLGWTLNGGGIITRVVKGYDDLNGYYFTGNGVPAPKAELGGGEISILRQLVLSNLSDLVIAIAGTANTGYLYYGNYSGGNCTGIVNFGWAPGYQPNNTDLEPDLFHFNFPGASGSFILDKNFISNGKVHFLEKQNLTVQGGIGGWTLTDGKGTKYSFQAQEWTLPQDGMGYTNYVQSWYLTKIESQLGDVITFDYGTSPFNNGVLESQANFIESAVNNTFLNAYYPVQRYQPRYLAAINFRNGKVEFLYDSQVRQDLTGAQRLQSIMVRDINQNKIKEFQFDHDYFDSDGNYYGYLQNAPTSKRLRLKGVKQFGTNQACVSLYSFNYNGTLLPSKTSLARDHWGYFNGINNTNLVPAFKGFVLNNNSQQTFTGGNRRADENTIKASVLERINFSTGGYTTFEYEINRYDNTGYANAPLLEPKIGGGLRIRRVVDYDVSGATTKVNRYEYEGGKLMSPPRYEQYRPLKEGDPNPSSDLSRSAQSNLPLSTSALGCYVGYDRVRVLTGENGEGGEEVNDFINQIDFAFGGLYMAAGIPSKPLNPLVGKQTSQTIYRKNGGVSEAVKSVQFTHQIELYETKAIYRPLPIYEEVCFREAYLYPIVSKWITTQKAVETLDGLSSETNYRYNSTNLQVHRKSLISSKGETFLTQYNYPNNSDIGDNVYNEMNSASIHINEPVIQERLYKDQDIDAFTLDESKRIFWKRNNYQKLNPNRFVPLSVQSSQGNNPLVDEINYGQNYDVNANPTRFVMKNGIATRLEWYTDGGKADLVKTHIIGDGTGLSQTTSYDYQPLVGMTRATDPNNANITYGYDNLNRLKEVRDRDGNLLKSYVYNYGVDVGCRTSQSYISTPSDNPQPPTSSLSFSNQSNLQNVPSSGGTYSFTVNSANVSWTLSNWPAWISSVNPTTGGNGNTTVSVTFQNNGGTTQRNGTMNLNGNGGQSQSVPLSQQGTVTTGGGNGSGLTGTYYNSNDLTGTAVLTRTDAQINFQWGQGGPGSPVNNDNFSVRWTGQVEAPASGTYTFKTFNDDGTRLWVNGVQLINDWNGHPQTWQQGTITLQAGQKYDIKIEYFEAGGDAASLLYWEYPGQTQQLIPTGRLYPGNSTPTNPAGCALTKVSVYPRGGGLEYRISGAKIQGSMTGRNGPWSDIMTLGSVPANSWKDFAAPASTPQYVALRYLSPDGGYCNVAEVQFWSGSTNLTSTATADKKFGDNGGAWGGSGNTYDKALDGIESTFYDCNNANGGYVGIEVSGCGTGGGGGCSTTTPSVNPQTASVCPGQTTTLTATGCSGTLAWSTGATTPSITVGTGTYTVTCTANGCTGPAASVTVSTSSGCGTINGCYTLLAQHTVDPNNPMNKRYLQSMGVGQILKQYAANGQNNQIWKFDPLGNGNHRLTSQSSGKVMSVQNGNVSEGTYLTELDDNNLTSQQWKLELVSGTSDVYRLKSPNTNLVADVEGNYTSDAAQLHLWTQFGAEGSANQNWKLASTSCPGSGGCSTPTPTISPAQGGSVCPGQTTTLTASGCTGTLTWSNGATTTSINVGVGTYSVTCTANGCTSPSSASVTVTNATGCGTTNYNGNSDGGNCDGTWGWAMDMNNLSQPISVDIYMDGQKIATVVANGERADLVTAFGTEAARYHGFGYSFPLGAPYKNGQPHTVKVKYANTTVLVPNSTRTITCNP